MDSLGDDSTEEPSSERKGFRCYMFCKTPPVQSDAVPTTSQQIPPILGKTSPTDSLQSIRSSSTVSNGSDLDPDESIVDLKNGITVEDISGNDPVTTAHIEVMLPDKYEEAGVESEILVEERSRSEQNSHSPKDDIVEGFRDLCSGGFGISREQTGRNRCNRRMGTDSSKRSHSQSVGTDEDRFIDEEALSAHGIARSARRLRRRTRRVRRVSTTTEQPIDVFKI
ncbi:MAG: hypothetical protein M1825_004860 [Sarcosagium campestre]|nr:MAG: hypothetical protein M1825_004860 [Sarcosagium campestre]